MKIIFSIGDRVVGTSAEHGNPFPIVGRLGTVQFVMSLGSPIHNDLIGVEFDEPMGGHDGHRYFKGKDGHCYFVLGDEIRKIGKKKTAKPTKKVEKGGSK